MKIVGWVIVAIIASVVSYITGIAIYVKRNEQRVIDDITFEFEIVGINFAQLFNPIVNVKTIIENKNPFPIVFSDLYVKLFYNGELIAKSEKIDKSWHFVPIKGKTDFEHEMRIMPSIVKIKQPITIDYEIDVRIFGFKIDTIKDSYTL